MLRRKIGGVAGERGLRREAASITFLWGSRVDPAVSIWISTKACGQSWDSVHPARGMEKKAEESLPVRPMYPFPSDSPVRSC